MKNKIENLIKALPSFILPGLYIFLLSSIGRLCLSSYSSSYYVIGIFCIALSAFTLLSVFYSLLTPVFRPAISKAHQSEDWRKNN